MRLLLASLLVLTSASLASAQAGWITKTSNASVDETADRLEAAIGNVEGATVFARIDHAGNASSADMELEPTTLVIFGNPTVGTPIIAANRMAGIDLPIHILVWEEDGETTIGYEDPAALRQRYAIEDADESFDAMTGALENLTTAAAGE